MIPALPIYTELLVEWASQHPCWELNWYPNTDFNEINIYNTALTSGEIRVAKIARGWVRKNGILYLRDTTKTDRNTRFIDWFYECDLKDPNCLISLERFLQSRI